MESIGTEKPEFLVHYPDLVDAMARAGLREPTPAEAKVLGLVGGAGTGMFEGLFDDMRGKTPPGPHVSPAVAKALAMTVDERRCSFLNRWFVFVKN